MCKNEWKRIQIMSFLNFLGGLALIKIIFTLFAVFAWSRAVIRFYTKDLNLKELFFWSLLWALMIVLVFVPGKTNFLAKMLGMERGNDAMFFLGIVALFYASYRLYVKSNEQEKEITRLVRALALKNIRKQKTVQRKRKLV
ncbi:MAG: hypothetical protein HW405_257 [Candidatus Berkelbacteria bacterium]|nr:hypothetical protein [Candidatus Berkelbacteria bacterium]